MLINDLKPVLRETYRGYVCTIPVIIFGYVPTRNRAGDREIKVLIDDVLMRRITELRFMREMAGGLQTLMITGTILIRGRSLKAALRQIETARIEIVGERWSGVMTGVSIEVVGPVEMKRWN